MRIIFWYSDKSREYALAQAFADGVHTHGHQCVIVEKGQKLPEFDAVCMVGVKSREMFSTCRDKGKTIIYFDKGYLRHKAGKRGTWEYWRVAVNAHHPTDYISKIKHPYDRMENMDIVIWPWRKTSKHIIIAGSSAKYHQFHGLYDPTRFAQKLVTEIQKRTHREIVYRPKPTWREAVPIPSTTFSPRYESISHVLKDAHCLVTHGSNACFEAILNGVPCVVLGDAVAKPISETVIDVVENPKLATMAERVQWLSNLAYCQWTLDEFRSGEAWKTIGGQVEN